MRKAQIPQRNLRNPSRILRKLTLFDSSSEEEVDEEKVDEILKKFEFLIVEVHPTRPGIKHTCPCHKQTIVDSDLEDDLDDDEEEEDPRKQYRCLLFPWETVRRDLDMDESTARNSNF